MAQQTQVETPSTRISATLPDDLMERQRELAVNGAAAIERVLDARGDYVQCVLELNRLAMETTIRTVQSIGSAWLGYAQQAASSSAEPLNLMASSMNWTAPAES